MSNVFSADHLMAFMKKRNSQRKLVNIILCAIITLLGVTATIY